MEFKLNGCQCAPNFAAVGAPEGLKPRDLVTCVWHLNMSRFLGLARLPRKIVLDFGLASLSLLIFDAHCGLLGVASIRSTSLSGKFRIY